MMNPFTWIKDNTKHPMLVAIVPVLLAFALGLAVAQWDRLFASMDKFLFGTMVVTPVVFYAFLMLALVLGIYLSWKGLKSSAARFSKTDVVRDGFTALRAGDCTWHWQWIGDEPVSFEVRCAEHDLELIMRESSYTGEVLHSCPHAGCKTNVRQYPVQAEVVRSIIQKELRDRRSPKQQDKSAVQGERGTG